MRLFSGATCTSQCKLRFLRANARLSALLYTFREYSLTLDCNGVFATRALLRLEKTMNLLCP